MAIVTGGTTAPQAAVMAGVGIEEVVAGGAMVLTATKGLWNDPNVQFSTGNNTQSPNLKWGNSQSKPTYGHTFTEHGQKQTPTQLKDRARSLDHQVGQWTDDQKAADFLTSVAQRGQGVHDVPLPENVPGRSFLPDGTEVSADMARVIVKPDGSIRTAYPYSSLYSTS